MNTVAKVRVWLVALAAGLAVWLLPLTVEAGAGMWIDEITTMVRDHQDIAKLEGRERGYDRYIGHLALVRVAFNGGDRDGTYVAMNQLMDMLKRDATDKRGIPVWSAKTIFDFCGKVTPNPFHDFKRHNPTLSSGGFDYWDDEVFDPASNG